MKILKNNFTKRIIIAKSLGFVIGLIGFFSLPYFFANVDMYFRLGMLFWYTTFGAIIGIMGIIYKDPAIKGLKLPWWIRGTFIGAWLDFMLALLMYNSLTTMMSGSIFDGISPFTFAIEGAILGFIIDGISTKFAGDGKKLCEDLEKYCNNI